MRYHQTVKISRNERGFLLTVAAGTLLFEIANQFDFGICTFLPAMALILYAGFKYPLKGNTD
jgi:hypothetical protein